MESWFSAPSPTSPLFTKQMKQLEKEWSAGEKWSGVSVPVCKHPAWCLAHSRSSANICCKNEGPWFGGVGRNAIEILSQVSP